MTTNATLFTAALGNCGLSLVGSPLPAKPDKLTGSVEHSITLHVITPGQVASTDAFGQTSVSGAAYHGVLTMNSKDRLKLHICQKHFKPLEAAENGMWTKGCIECN